MSGTTNSNDSAVVIGPRHQTLPIGSLLVTPTGGVRGRVADLLAFSGTITGSLVLNSGGGDTAMLKFHTTIGDTASIDLGPGGSLHIARYASGVLVDYPLQTGPDGVILIDGRVWIRGINANSPNPVGPQPVLIEPPTTFGGSSNNALTITPGAAAANSVVLSTGGAGGVQITAGRLKLSAIPTSAAGLVAGDVWRNGNVLNIV